MQFSLSFSFFLFFASVPLAPWLHLNSTFQMLIYPCKFRHQSCRLMNDAWRSPCHVKNIKMLAPHGEAGEECSQSAHTGNARF